MPEFSANIASWLAGHAQTRGDALALTDTERRLDYAELDARVQRCAGALAARGVQAGDRVALVLGNSTSYLETLFAAARLGAIAVPLNARLTAPELRGLLADCTPRVLVSDARHADAAREAGEALGERRFEQIPDARAYAAALAAATPHSRIASVAPEDPAILMYTSGTTGVPKGALLPHRKALYNAKNAEIFFGLTPQDRVLVVLPLFHSFGLKILSLPTLYAGGSVHLAARFDPERIWDRVGTDGICFFGGVPTMFRALLETLEAAPPDRFHLDTLRFLFTAGEAIPLDVIRGFEAQGLVLQQGFGQTETSILCCLDARDAIRKAGSVGRPVRHVELRLIALDSLDGPAQEWRDVTAGETGEIVARGPITMTGYWQRPRETAAVLHGEWLRTGDLAMRDDEGFYTLVGRARHMFISGGENVYPAEIEAIYEEHPAVSEIAVVGVPDSRWGEVGHAYCVPARGERIEADVLREWGAQRLADFKLPRRFFEVAELPRTETGKIKKHELRG